MAAAGLVVGLPGVARAQQATVRWNSAVDGDWLDPLMWSGGAAPENDLPAGTTYRVVFDATGAPYIVTLGTAATVDEVSLQSSDATLRLQDGAFLHALEGIDLASGMLRIDGGAITSSTINITGGLLSISTSESNLFDGVTINGDFALDQKSALAITNGLTLNGACRLAGDESRLGFYGSQTLAGGTLLFDTDLGFDMARIALDADATLTISPDTTIRGGNGELGLQTTEGASNTIVNEGLISADRSGARLVVTSGTFINSGVAEARGGGTLSITSPAWQNTGTLLVEDGTLNLGGTFTRADLGTLQRAGGGGAVNLTGTLDNSGQTFRLDGATGSWGLDGGTVLGGTLELVGGATLSPSASYKNTLDGVSLVGELLLSGDNARVKVTNGFTLDGTVRLAGAQSLFGFQETTTLEAGTISFESTAGQPGRLAIEGTQTLTLGAGVAVIAADGARGTLGRGVVNDKDTTVVNQGVVTATGINSRIDLLATHFINEGAINAQSGGTITLGLGVAPGAAWSNSGVINVDGGTLLLGGDTTPGGLGTIHATSGAIFIAGNLDATGSTITTSSGVTFGLLGGGITNGTVVTHPDSPLLIEQDLPSATPYLRNVTIVGNAAVNTPGVAFRIDDGLTLEGTLSVNATGTTIYCNSDQVIRGGTMAFNAPSGVTAWLVSDGNTLTIDEDATIRGRRVEITRAGFDTAFVNNGRILADAVGGIVLNTHTVVNNGLVDITGGSVTFSGVNGSTNAGVINLSAGSLNLGSSFTQAPGGVINQTGGIVRLVGTFNNAGASVDLDGPSSVWSLESGGVVSGGEVAIRNGAIFNVVQGQLRGVDLTGNIALSNANVLSISNSLTLDGEIALGAGSTLRIDSTGAATDTVTIDGGSIRLNRGNGGYNDAVTITGNRTLHLSPTTTLHGGNGWVGRRILPSTFTGILNEGAIVADVPNNRLRIQSTLLDNRGVIEAVNGASLEIDYETTVVNTGVIRAGLDSFVYFGGRTTTANLGDIDGTLGTFTFTGLLDNTADTFTVSESMGTLHVTAGGAIKGGHLHVEPTARLEFGNGLGVLDGVSVTGGLDVGDFGRLEIRNGLDLDGEIRLAGAQAQLRFATTTTLASGRIVFDPAGGGGDRGVYTAREQVATLGAGASIEGGRGVVFTSNLAEVLSSFVNEGLIHANLPAERILIYTARFLNTGTLLSSNGGQLQFQPPGLAPGEQVVLTNAGAVEVSPDSVMHVGGSLQQSPDAVLRLSIGAEIAGAPLVVDDLISLDGLLDVRWADANATPRFGDLFRLFDAGRVEGIFGSISLPGLPDELSWDVSGLYTDGSIRAVPAPSALVPCVVLSLAAAARRRRAVRNGESKP